MCDEWTYVVLTVSPCEVYPCKNGGICSHEKDGGFKCACRNGYGGQMCNKKGIPFHLLFTPNINLYL